MNVTRPYSGIQKDCGCGQGLHVSGGKGGYEKSRIARIFEPVNEFRGESLRLFPPNLDAYRVRKRTHYSP
jgi:hypothetical protein